MIYQLLQNKFSFQFIFTQLFNNFQMFPTFHIYGSRVLSHQHHHHLHLLFFCSTEMSSVKKSDLNRTRLHSFLNQTKYKILSKYDFRQQKMDETIRKICEICKLSDTNEYDYGEWMTSGDCTIHYFCAVSTKFVSSIYFCSIC